MSIKTYSFSNKAIAVRASITTSRPPIWYVIGKKSGQRRYMLFDISVLKQPGRTAIGITVLSLYVTLSFPWMTR